jgi:hypothetical protein
MFSKKKKKVKVGEPEKRNVPKNNKGKMGVAMHTYNSSTGEVKAGGLKV